MHLRWTLAIATVAFSPAAFSQSLLGVTSDVFQINVATNLDRGDSYLNMTNSGANTRKGVGQADGTSDPSQDICANLYTFDPASELISCCACSVTPDGLQSSTVSSLISNPLTPAIPTAVTVKVVANTASLCNPSAVTADTLAHGLLVWNTTLHQNTSTATPTFSLTETAYTLSALTAEELAHITSTCGFIQANGSGFGLCKGCATGGLGSATSLQ